MTAHVETPPTGALARRFPPVAQLVMASLALAIIGAIYMASKFPRRPPLALPTTLVVASALVALVAFVLMARVRDFAWPRFRLVFGWALLAYAVQAGMIEYALVKNDARGAPLAVFTLMLVMFALDVPFLIAFTSARYATPPTPAGA